MIWVSIIGIVFFLITFYVIKHTYEDRYFDYKEKVYKYKESDKVYLAIGWYILILIVYLVPILNVATFLVALIGYIVYIVDNDIYFNPTGIVKKICDFLSKKV